MGGEAGRGVYCNEGHLQYTRTYTTHWPPDLFLETWYSRLQASEYTDSRRSSNTHKIAMSILSTTGDICESRPLRFSRVAETCSEYWRAWPGDTQQDSFPKRRKSSWKQRHDPGDLSIGNAQLWRLANNLILVQCVVVWVMSWEMWNLPQIWGSSNRHISFPL